MRKNIGRVFAFALILALCLLPVAAYAAATGEEFPPVSVPEESPSPELPGEETEIAADETEADTPVLVGPLDSFFAPADSVVYNNAGIVYNNGGVVYNNAGTVYSNGGVVYNNAGTVYGNAGTIYNNGGTVYNNGATVYNNGAPSSDSEAPLSGGEAAGAEAVPLEPGWSRLWTEADYSASTVIEGLTEPGEAGFSLLSPEAVCVIRPREGYRLLSAEAEGGSLEPSSDGGYVLSPEGEDVRLRLQLQPDAPEFGQAPGTYGQELTVALTAPEGARIYYTTDGSDPSEESEPYTEPLLLREGLLLRAIAVAEGTQSSEISEAAYAVITVTAPEFEPVTPPYERPEPLGIAVENPGQTEARIQRVELVLADNTFFLLNRSLGQTIPAGSTDAETWTVQPYDYLQPGEYRNSLLITLDSGEKLELELSFTVLEAEN